MIFRNYQEVLRGEVTETWRPRGFADVLTERNGEKVVLSASGRVRFGVGRTYAVQPGMAKREVGAIRVLDITMGADQTWVLKIEVA